MASPSHSFLETSAITLISKWEISNIIEQFGICPFAGSSSGSSYPDGLKRAHGALNLFAWGVLLPIGAIIARYCRRWDPLWFYLHAGIQLVGFILGLAGIVAGVSLYNKIQADVPAHRGLGIFVLVLGILQVCSFFLVATIMLVITMMLYYSVHVQHYSCNNHVSYSLSSMHVLI